MSIGPGDGPPRQQPVRRPSTRLRVASRCSASPSSARTGPLSARPLSTRPGQVVDEQHADEVIEVVFVDGKAAVPDPRTAWVMVSTASWIQRDDVDPGCHRLAEHGDMEVVEGVDDELLLRIGTALRLAPVGPRGPTASPGSDGGPACSVRGGCVWLWRRNMDTMVTLLFGGPSGAGGYGRGHDREWPVGLVLVRAPSRRDVIARRRRRDRAAYQPHLGTGSSGQEHIPSPVHSISTGTRPRLP